MQEHPSHPQQHGTVPVFSAGKLEVSKFTPVLGSRSQLDALAGNLDEFPRLHQHLPQVCRDVLPEEWDLLHQKGVYPYSHIKNFSVFEETSLPPREAFHNDLTGDDLPQEKYEFAQTVWDTTGCLTLGDYHDLYLYQDIFSPGRHLWKILSSMPHELSARSSAFLYSTRSRVGRFSKVQESQASNLSDIEMHQFLERGMRGGLHDQ